MAAKVKWDRGAWWVVTHYDGKRRKRRVGPAKAHKRDAQEIAKKINGALALGTFAPGQDAQKALSAERELWRWHTAYSPTFKPSFQAEGERVIRVHLVPAFGSKDLREIRERDLLDFIQSRISRGLRSKTIENALSVLRRVYNVLQREELVERNPVARIGELMRRVENARADETQEVEHWSEEEIHSLLQVARETEPRFAPLLMLLFSTGLRRGEVLGLQWSDIDEDRGRLHVNKAMQRVRGTGGRRMSKESI